MAKCAYSFSDSSNAADLIKSWMPRLPAWCWRHSMA